ncbi:DoxX protein [Aestuariivivens sp. NBU2969]|uniref:DoxX protein n=1 Tax=Aestuariivivens sp. NBU2969 TaxID=2873267 RepID=UPI001CBC0B17|nr:DoxX protein [Aestuariivivens sp. NBU2969]
MATSAKFSPLLRIILGLFLIVYALNQFFHFIPFTYGEMPENTRDFIDAVAIYLPYLYIFEIIIGLFLIFNKWVPFILIVLFPLSVSFLIFNLSDNDFSKIWTALIVAFLNIMLLLGYKEKYKPLFK